MTHELKIDPKYFELVQDGIKNWEIRKNDRKFKVGDIVRLKEYQNDTFTNRELIRRFIGIFDEFGLDKGYVILTLKNL